MENFKQDKLSNSGVSVGEAIGYKPAEHKAEMLEILHCTADRLGKDLHDEIDRLMGTGAVPDGAAITAVLKVALENLADKFAVNGSARKIYKNLQKF